MKTLIINGSTRKNGDTAALLDAFLSVLHGEYKIISYDMHISPCMDCRYCWTHAGCAVRDDMQAVYAYLEDCDNVVLASPVWFSSLSGPTLHISSRLQTYFAGKRFRKEAVLRKAKKGVILVAGAQPGTEEMPVQNAKTILSIANVKKDDITVVRAMHTDHLPAVDDTAALQAARDAAQRLNCAGDV